MMSHTSRDVGTFVDATSVAALLGSIDVGVAGGDPGDQVFGHCGPVELLPDGPLTHTPGPDDPGCHGIGTVSHSPGDRK